MWGSRSGRQGLAGSLTVGGIIAAGVMAGSLLVSAPTAEAATFKVTETVSSTKVNEGDAITISGKLSGKTSSRKVYVQRRYSGSKTWSTVATVRTSGGRFSTKLTMTNDRNRYYRVYKPKEGKYKKDYSSSIHVTVYKLTTKTTVLPYGKTTVRSAAVTMCEPAKVTTKGVNGAIVRYYRDGKLWKTNTSQPVTQVTTVGASTAPCITSLTPKQGRTEGGTKVTITGRNLDRTTRVGFGSVTAQVASVSDTQVQVVAPELPGGSHTVTLSDGSATVEAGTFRAIPPAELAAITPSTGIFSGGETIAITGQGLSGTSKVRFTPIVPADWTTSGDGSMPSVDAKFDIVNDGKLTVVVPPGVSAKTTVTVVTDTGTVTGSYTYQLTSRQPTHAEQFFLDLVNDYRAKGYSCDTIGFTAAPAAPLAWDGKLADLALSHSRDIHYRQDVYEAMARDGITHLSPGLVSASARYDVSGSDAAGEILTGGVERNRNPIKAHEPTDGDVDAYFHNFLNSYGHCVAIMAPNEFTRIGVGIDVVNTTPNVVDTKINANLARG